MTVAVGWSEVCSNTPDPVKVHQHILEEALLRIEVHFVQISIARRNYRVPVVVIGGKEARNIDNAIEVSEYILEEALLRIEVHLVQVTIIRRDDCVTVVI